MPTCPCVHARMHAGAWHTLPASHSWQMHASLSRQFCLWHQTALLVRHPGVRRISTLFDNGFAAVAVEISRFQTSCTSMTLHARLRTHACTQASEFSRLQHQSWATCVVGHTRGRLTAMACMRKLFSPNSLAGTTYTSWKRGVQTAGAGQPGTTILPRYQAVSGKIRLLSPVRATLRDMVANMHVFTHAHPCIQ